MSLRNTRPLSFTPFGLSDSLDETLEFEGACASLKDLIPDQTTKGVWGCRPASILQTNFGPLTAPGFVSVYRVIGSYVYGMVASGLHTGKDQPFCFNLVTGLFVTVAGITAANVPTSPLDTGDWTPPTMALVGPNLVVTHPGFDGVSNFIGWFDITTPSAPVWHAGNITGMITFSTVPAWVSQFNGRGYFGVNPPTGQPSAVFTDPLTLNVTNANQALTFGDNMPLVAAGGLPLTNQLGGIISSLMVFKNAQIHQITGDAAQSNLAINALQVPVGTYSPRSLCSTPTGLAFLAPDGLRIIDLDARVGSPIGVDGTGINVPFINPLHPSRAAAGTNAGVMRISVQNSSIAAPVYQEFWYDLAREMWSGPHSFPATCYDTYQNAFVISPVNANATLFLSPTTQSPTSSFIENGQQMTWGLQTVMLADAGDMAQSELAEMHVMVAQGVATSFDIVAQDQDGNPYGTATYTFTATQSLWGSMVWGTDTWGGGQSALYPRQIAFSDPVVYNRLALSYSGLSCNGFKISTTSLRRRALGYMQEYA